MKKAQLLFLCAVVCLLANAASAQNLVEFLGPKYDSTVKLSPKYRIPYRDNGFATPLERRAKKAIKRGAPPIIVEEIRLFPGSPDAIGQWVDEAWDEAVATFMKCGGALAQFAAQLSPTTLTGGIEVESTIWYEPSLQAYLSGGYYPATHSIRVVNIYYGTTGDYRHARLLLRWEMKNHFAYLAGLTSEPTTPDWPCHAQ
jgi:hypothetical protein